MEKLGIRMGMGSHNLLHDSSSVALAKRKIVTFGRNEFYSESLVYCSLMTYVQFMVFLFTFYSVLNLFPWCMRSFASRCFVKLSINYVRHL